MCQLLTKQRADEEAAKLYESFVESFEVEQRGGPQHGGGGHDPNGGFVRGGVVMPGQSPNARKYAEVDFSESLCVTLGMLHVLGAFRGTLVTCSCTAARLALPVAETVCTNTSQGYVCPARDSTKARNHTHPRPICHQSIPNTLICVHQCFVFQI